MENPINDVRNDILAAFEPEARKLVEDAGYRFRIGVRDGKASMGACNVDPMRINAELVNGAVVKTWVG